MRELTITPENLREITAEQREVLKKAIAEAKSIKDRETDALPHNQRIHEENVRIRAECTVANKVLHRVPTHEEIVPCMARAHAEIMEIKEKNNWYYGVHILENVPRFGTAEVMVPDNYQAPWKEKVVSIEDGRQIVRREEPQPRKMVAAAGARWTSPIAEAS